MSAHILRRLMNDHDNRSTCIKTYVERSNVCFGNAYVLETHKFTLLLRKQTKHQFLTDMLVNKCKENYCQ